MDGVEIFPPKPLEICGEFWLFMGINPLPFSTIPADAEAPGENLQRKSSKAKSGSSPLQTQPGSHSKPVLPPIPPGRKSTNSWWPLVSQIFVPPTLSNPGFHLFLCNKAKSVKYYRWIHFWLTLQKKWFIYNFIKKEFLCFPKPEIISPGHSQLGNGGDFFLANHGIVSPINFSLSSPPMLWI